MGEAGQWACAYVCKYVLPLETQSSIFTTEAEKVNHRKLLLLRGPSIGSFFLHFIFYNIYIVGSGERD